ncbi:unnamed protein product, partial [Effrenium voratum]
ELPARRFRGPKTIPSRQVDLHKDIQYEEALEDVKQVRKKTPSAVIFMDGHQAIGSKILRDEADLCIWIEVTWEIRLARSNLEKHKDSWERFRIWTASVSRPSDELRMDTMLTWLQW